MQRQALPPDFEETRDTTAQDLESVPDIKLEAVHVLERCMAEHHIAEVDYTEPDSAIVQNGLIGLQIHGGNKAEVYFRNMTIQEF